MSNIGIALVLDQGLPRDAAVALRKAGVDCVHVGEMGLSRAEDIAIIELARRLEAVIVTLDADFHAMLAAGGARKPSAIRLRLQGLNGTQVSELVLHLLQCFADEIGQGALITVKAKKTTCHLLPVGSGSEGR